MNKSDYLSDDQVILVPLTTLDSKNYFNLYRNEETIADYQGKVFEENETPESFTARIINSCFNIWTLRLVSEPYFIIGDCALHDYNEKTKEIEIGGALLPNYWGKGYMKAAFRLAIMFAQKELDLINVTARTSLKNEKAVRFAEKMGFEKVNESKEEVFLRKRL